jgi:tRNA (guanine37-N1)-methyltransferase
MRFDIITIFPDIFDSYLNESILKRAQAKKLIQIKIHNLRDFTKDKHKKVDDRPYGGGPGMVIRVEPVVRAIASILNSKSSNSKFKILNSKQIPNSKFKKIKIILFTPTGKEFNNKMAAQLANNYNHLILICGRYEGIDERVKKVILDLGFKVLNLSIGPYVLTGGELPAMVLIDAVARQIPGVLGKKESVEEKRLGVGVPVYTRPEIFIFKNKKYKVPKVLLSGDHKEIITWREKHRYDY